MMLAIMYLWKVEFVKICAKKWNLNDLVNETGEVNI
jgi:hypothetical protein